MALQDVFLILLCFVSLLGGEPTIHYYVTPRSSPVNESFCFGYQPCHTLDQYAINGSHYFHWYTKYTLQLFDGVHELTAELFISGIEGLEFYSDPFAGTNAVINVTHGSFNVSNVSSLILANITFSTTLKRKFDCPEIWLSEILNVILNSVQFEEVLTHVRCNGPQNTMFSFHNSSVQYSKFLFKLENTIFSITTSKIIDSTLDVTLIYTGRYSVLEKSLCITNCTVFGQSIFKVSVFSEIHVSIIDFSGIAYSDVSDALSILLTILHSSHIQLTIKRSFLGDLDVQMPEKSILTMNLTEINYFRRCSPFFKIVSTQGLKIFQSKGSQLLLTVYDSVFKCSGGINIQAVQEEKTSLLIYSTQFYLNRQALRIHSTGLHLYVFLFNVSIFRNVDSNTFHIIAAQSSVELVKCYFYRNIGYNGACIYYRSQAPSSLLMEEVSLYQNFRSGVNSAVVSIAFCNNVTISNSQFLNNVGTPLEIVSGRVFLSGRTLFENNTAQNGGGLSLIGSRVTFTNGSKTVFRSNKALDTGGALYLSRDFVHHILTLSSYTKMTKKISRCFFDASGLDIYLQFQSNSAVNGGDDIYGTYLYYGCIASSNPLTVLKSNFLRQLFKITNSISTSLSAVSSDPQRVCVCNGNEEPQCASLAFIHLKFTVYPGERFTVPLVVVGEEFGTVAGTAYATLLGRTTGSLEQGQDTQRTKVRHCTLAEYSVLSSQPFETISLTATGGTPIMVGQENEIVKKHIKNQYSENRHFVWTYEHTKEIERQLLVTPIYFNVTLEQCPLGFQLTGDLPSCKCQQELVENNVRHCIILNHTGYVYRSGTTWVNATFSATENDTLLLVHKYCPYNYCVNENISVDLRHPDTQCALGHSGTLCGGCQKSLSVALGSNQCLECSNSNHIALLVFFVAAGLVLVFFIKAINLTVSKGTINGLIFYVNIIWAEQSILYSKQTIGHRVITVFIAWLNLDFGIETCFAQGLTAYQKVWLQFVFPVYVWCIVGLMILSAHYSTLATKLFGNNSVPVLATLFLMSFAKLLRTIITVLGFAVLKSKRNSTTVWLFDGNIPYLGLEHAFLFITAMLALLFLWLPYMVTLLVVPLLRSKTHYRLLRWITRWKPFYDAYFGPLRVNHQYWIGTLLIVRVFLLVMFASTSPNVNLLVLTIVTTSLLMYVATVGPIYKRKYLSFVENSFLLNLNVLAAGVLYQNVVGGDKGLIVYVLVGTVFVKFVCITIYHCFVTVKSYVAARSSRIGMIGAAQTNGRAKAKDKWSFPLREELLDTNDSL